ncbi:hypothetical protein MVEN_02199500 [Mycena venus]|uniref:Uncharacterized protein n=1 Tax=Mycena venus TaxID=2733690 RepID=A0A8H6X6N2_9AGAR|nr:hypothetical protein MVEN_02199500 [Mycena venus]
MHFLKAVAFALPFIGTVLSAPESPRNIFGGLISAPAAGTVIAPGQSFAFSYDTMADFGVSSYNFSVWLLTELPTSFEANLNFATGHFFGRYAEANFPGNPFPKNPAPPANLTMPDFSKSEGGFGSGESAIAKEVALVVIEEYATGDPSLGDRLTLAINKIIYNGTAA